MAQQGRRERRPHHHRNRQKTFATNVVRRNPKIDIAKPARPPRADVQEYPQFTLRNISNIDIKMKNIQEIAEIIKTVLTIINIKFA
jgi:hypothetical protein